jgi:hypothetical protein
MQNCAWLIPAFLFIRLRFNKAPIRQLLGMDSLAGDARESMPTAGFVNPSGANQGLRIETKPEGSTI